jgi:flagellar hook-associated protein 1 FlgK
MAGLFDTLALGSRSLQTYRKAIDTAGHNLANVNTPGYTRQRLVVESISGVGDTGAAGGGAEATRIVGLRNEFAQKQLRIEASMEGSLEVRDEALRQTLTALQETIDRTSEGGTSTNGISQRLNEFFGAVQSLSTNPSSIPDRQVFLQKAQDLAAKFNLVDQRLAGLGDDLNTRLNSEVARANDLMTQIAGLNQRITGEEAGYAGSANDLRDTRQAKIEELARIIKLDAVEQANGSVNIVADGQVLVDGITIPGALETFDPGNANPLVRISGQAAPLAIGSGAIEGILAVRDGELARVRDEVNGLATLFISEVNAVHETGFGLDGTTGAPFFNGTNASDIAVNRDLLANSSLLQASDVVGDVGNNAKILALTQLETKAHPSLGGQSFIGKHIQTVATLAQELVTARTNLEDQQSMTRFVQSQRDSVSAVSLDEEMANLVMFQKAFQASAKLISMTDEMLTTIIGM